MWGKGPAGMQALYTGKGVAPEVNRGERISCMPLSSVNVAHFESQRRRHQTCEIGVSVAPKMDMCPRKILFIKFPNNFIIYTPANFEIFYFRPNPRKSPTRTLKEMPKKDQLSKKKKPQTWKQLGLKIGWMTPNPVHRRRNLNCFLLKSYNFAMH